MSNTPKPRTSNAHNISFFIGAWEVSVHRQDERTRGEALTDDSKAAIIMSMCPVDLETHLVLDLDRCDTYASRRLGTVWSKCGMSRIRERGSTTASGHKCIPSDVHGRYSWSLSRAFGVNQHHLLKM